MECAETAVSREYFSVARLKEIKCEIVGFFFFFFLISHFNFIESMKFTLGYSLVDRDWKNLWKIWGILFREDGNLNTCLCSRKSSLGRWVRVGRYSSKTKVVLYQV